MPNEQRRTLELKYRPPHDWEKRLSKLASDADLELGTTYQSGDTIHFYIKTLLPLPGAPSSSPERRLQAFEDAARQMLEDPTLPRDPPKALTHKSIFRGEFWYIVGSCLMFLGLITLFLHERLNINIAIPIATISLSLISVFKTDFLLSLASDSFHAGSANTLRETLRRQEELFNRLSAAQSGGETSSELAKAALIFRANSAKDDQERIWRRSDAAFRLGCFFFMLSLAGPATSYWTTLNSPTTGWHHYIPSFSLSAIMLTAAAALLRYDGKLREHFQAKADEVAYLNRLQLAVDSARSVSDTTYRNTLRNIITQLVTPPPTLISSNRPLTEEPQSLPQDALIQTANNLINAAVSRIPSAHGANQGPIQPDKPRT
ncbi:hypothetical protein HPP05_01630 [Corallococcus exiguus]|uniref:hypothetical protein n=1 Tax=Corallococcus exiguus TaxID=83462 RepID=UPI001494E258|nr:hypothetical protein [Corallococcus exiguus]NPC68447.1 hypothetical protein [Corallococcus exiguus]